MNQHYVIASTARTEVPDLQKFDMHTHDTYELFCFMAGSADYFVEGTIYSLAPGDILIMKKAEAHTLMVNSAIPYERAVVHFNAEAILGDKAPLIREFLDDRPLGRYNRYPAALFKKTNWQYYLRQMYTNKHDPAQMQIYLTVLLKELYDAYPRICSEESVKPDAIVDIIDHINTHLTELSSVEQLCTKFYISRAQLNRKFRKATGSSVWEYITTKRLLLAKELLQNGQPPATVCAKVGFNDYSPFYRAYRAKFGVSPKADQTHG